MLQRREDVPESVPDFLKAANFLALLDIVGQSTVPVEGATLFFFGAGYRARRSGCVIAAKTGALGSCHPSLLKPSSVALSSR